MLFAHWTSCPTSAASLRSIVCVVRSLLPASEKRVAAHEERVGRFAKKSSCEGAMPAVPCWFWFSVPRRPFWHEIDVAMPDFRGANRERCVSYVTLRWLSKKCTCAGLNCGPRRASR
jgi:hypothetical protein